MDRLDFELPKREYFEALAEFSKLLFDRLPISKSPQPLQQCVPPLEKAVEELRHEKIAELQAIPYHLERQHDVNIHEGIGMNTVGLLVDRFSISLIKEWCLRNKDNKSKKIDPDELYRTQTADIMICLAHARPGFSSLNTKITSIQTGADANNWEEAFYGLVTTNLIIWESQEILYLKDISILPPEELRDYIKFFSTGNMRRNELIEACERCFWSKFKDRL